MFRLAGDRGSNQASATAAGRAVSGAVRRGEGYRRAPEIAAAYWASMGLSPHAAETSFQNCRVRIQSIDVQGAKTID